VLKILREPAGRATFPTGPCSV